MALRVGHPLGTNSGYVIGCCLIPLGICGPKNNSRRITYGGNRVCMGDAFSVPFILSWVGDVSLSLCYFDCLGIPRHYVSLVYSNANKNLELLDVGRESWEMHVLSFKIFQNLGFGEK